MIDIYAEIRKRYGNVRRARGYYLYTEKNVRLLDLYLDGGSALLGRRAGQANAAFKQFLDRGLTGFLPTKADAQLRRALFSLLPEYPLIRWYESGEKAERLVRAAQCSVGTAALSQASHGGAQDGAVPNGTAQGARAQGAGGLGAPVCPETAQGGTVPSASAQGEAVPTVSAQGGTVPVWRPFLAEYSPFQKQGAARIMLVPPAYDVPCGIIAADSAFAELLPPSDALFPPLLYALARAFFDLARRIAAFRAVQGGEQNTPKENMQKARVNRLIVKKEQTARARRKEVERLIPRVWTQNGWYLFPHIPQPLYTELFFQALEAHLLLSPDYHTPSILPECEHYTELVGFLKARNA